MRRVVVVSTFVVVLALCMSLPAEGAPARGLGVSMPLVGRLAGGGGSSTGPQSTSRTTRILPFKSISTSTG